MTFYRHKHTAEFLDRLRQALTYDPETGHCSWLVSRGAAKVGKRAGTTQAEGYVIIRFEGVAILAHLFAWYSMTGEWPTLEVDHKNGERDDNRWENLRHGTRTQNHFNRRPQGASMFKGVFASSKNRWGARIDRRFLGSFRTPEEAARAYDREALKRDPFSYLNFPLPTPPKA